jgi:CBS domain-containing protein
MIDLEAFWTNRTCGELVNHQSTVIIDSQMKVEDACHVLSQSGVSSAPVYDNERKQYVGMFDYGDIVTFLLAIMGKEDIPEYETDLKEIIEKGLRMGPVPVHMISDLSLRNPFIYVLPEASLLEAVQFFAQGIHRIVVMNPDLSLKGILSQSSLVTHIVNHVSYIKIRLAFIQRIIILMEWMIVV